MNNNDTRTPAELQEWLAQVEQRAAAVLVVPAWFRSPDPANRVIDDIPRLCQELRRAWALNKALAKAARAAYDVLSSAGDFRDFGQWVAVDHGDLIWLRDCLLSDEVLPLLEEQTQSTKEQGGQDE